MKTAVTISLLAALGSASAADMGFPDLPPSVAVVRVLRSNPSVQAATSQIRAEEAQHQRLESGTYEWHVKLGSQQRRTTPTAAPNERFREWDAALERPLRLPGKAALDSEIGQAGVLIAETARGDALHEAGRSLLKGWFAWLKESAAAEQWQAQTALLEKHARDILRRQQLGDAARLEAIQAEGALAQAQAQLTQAQVRQRTAGEDLRRRFPGLPLEAPRKLSDPQPINGGEEEWVDAVLEHSHELGVARGESRRARFVAGRAGQDRLPDPTFGVHVSRERSGEEQVLGAYISIPLPGGARRASADAASALSDAATHREAAALQKIRAEAATLYHNASAALASWQAGQSAAERLTRVADMTGRAYQLGEGNLNDLLTARRLANEAQLAARQLRLEALELRYRLLLDAHRLWVLEEEHGHSE